MLPRTASLALFDYSLTLHRCDILSIALTQRLDCCRCQPAIRRRSSSFSELIWTSSALDVLVPLAFTHSRISRFSSADRATGSLLAIAPPLIIEIEKLNHENLRLPMGVIELSMAQANDVPHDCQWKSAATASAR
jgi:hypothetical protein